MSGNREGGSRFLYEPFDANRARIEANQQLQDQRWATLEGRLDGIEENIDRLDKRLWIMVYGIVAIVLSRAVNSLVVFANGL
ncbi:MAG: hypothetical protein AAF429_13940 [Pseudomonadota bacterium]